MSEQPLETSVYDSMDKADADEAGNDPLDDEERLLALQQASATHTLKMAKAQGEVARANETSGEDDFDRAIGRVRDEESHMAGMRRDEEAHASRMESERQSRRQRARQSQSQE